MRRWGSRGRLVGALLGAAVVASACGSGATAEESGFKISTLAENTAQARSARYEGSERWSLPFASGEAETTFEGEIDFAKDSSTWVGTRQDTKEQEVTHSRRVGGYSYYENLDLGGFPASEKPWTRTKAWPEQAGFGADVANVAGLLDQLERWGGRGEKVGIELIRGVSTVHYQFTFPARPVPQQVIAMRMTSEPAAQTFDVWADAEQRLRRMEERVEGSSDHREVEYFDFGAPVAIEAPPADQVMDEEGWQVTGDWEPVQRGRAGSVAWEVFRAPEADGWCLSHEAEPAGPWDDYEIPEQRGRVIETCTDSTLQPEPGVPRMVDAGFNPAARPLANRMALLFGSVDPGTRSVAVHLKDGRILTLTPDHETFAVALGADDVATEIVPDLPGHEISCTLRGQAYGYLCEDTSQQGQVFVDPSPGFPGAVPPASPAP